MAKNSKSPGVSNRNQENEPVRLNKYIAECGAASRRRADELISEGSVLVNGKKVYELGTKVYPGVDRITVKGKPLKPPTHKIYILFNKPKHVVTTMNDPMDRPTIADYFDRLPVRVFPVGRLDWDTEGMILLTNDGEFAQKVNHPSEEIMKTYLVKINGRASSEQLEKMRRGVSIIGGKVSAKGIERIRRGDSSKYDWIKIMISEGKNRQIRQMFEKIGFDVMKLQRVAIGRLRMPTSLKRGEYVFLTEKGLDKIFQREPMGPTADTKPARKGSSTAKGKKKTAPQRGDRRPKSLKSTARAAASRNEGVKSQKKTKEIFG